MRKVRVMKVVSQYQQAQMIRKHLALSDKEVDKLVAQAVMSDEGGFVLDNPLGDGVVFRRFGRESEAKRLLRTHLVEASRQAVTAERVDEARVNFPLRSLDYTGVFHCFMQEACDGETYVVAVVEDSDGRITTPLATSVEFENAEV